MKLIDCFDGNNCIYRFWDDNENVLYVGRTSNLVRRLAEHYHLPKECYERIHFIDYAPVETETAARLYELYYINKHQPEYNKKDKFGSTKGIAIEELSFLPFKENFVYLLDVKTKNIDFYKLGDCYLRFDNPKVNKSILLKYTTYREFLEESTNEDLVDMLNDFFDDPKQNPLPDYFEFLCPEK